MTLQPAGSGYLRPIVLACAVALAAPGCEYGIGSRPYNENAHAIPSSGSRSVRLTGCVMERDGRIVLQAVGPLDAKPPGPIHQPASADAGGGSASAAPPLVAPPQLKQSTAANGPWIGTRSYVFADPAAVRSRIGSMVIVTGHVTVPNVRAAGTDQVHAANGAVYPVLEARSVEPGPGRCSVRSSLPYQQ